VSCVLMSYCPDASRGVPTGCMLQRRHTQVPILLAQGTDPSKRSPVARHHLHNRWKSAHECKDLVHPSARLHRLSRQVVEASVGAAVSVSVGESANVSASAGLKPPTAR
jgi:hypothetical protein